MTVRIHEGNFKEEVLDAKEPILIDFWARWCAPCRMLAPILEQVEANHPGLRIGKLDIDLSPELALRYGVSAIPMLIYFKNGEPAKTSVGLVTAGEIEAMLE